MRLEEVLYEIEFEVCVIDKAKIDSINEKGSMNGFKYNYTSL